MSVRIATMGMFNPAVGSGTTTIIRRGGGGGSIITTPQKPILIVSLKKIKETTRKIEVVLIEEKK